jgi:hypothetical protein
VAVTGVPGADEVFLTADDLVARVARGPLTIRHVVEVVRGGHPAGLVPLHRAVALQALWRRGFTHHHDPARALRLLSDVVSGATCWRLDVAEPGAQAALLEQLA